MPKQPSADPWRRWHRLFGLLLIDYLHLFSAAQEKVKYGAEHHRLHSPDLSSIVNQLFGEYEREGLTMPYTMEDFRREVALENLGQLTPEERLRGLTPEQRLAGLSESELMALLAELQKHSPTSKPAKAKRRRRS
jgi:hypothetical protein